MSNRNRATSTYLAALRKDLPRAALVVSAIIILVTIGTVLFRNSMPRIVYQPASACDLLTVTEAQELLGNRTFSSTINNPVISGDAATSRCGYTDGNPDTNNMIVAAVIVRSAINDNGIEKNKTDFATGASSKNAKTVPNVGDRAFFNTALGQLNVLHSHEWIIMSFGPGSDPQANTVDQAVTMAHKILTTESSNT